MSDDTIRVYYATNRSCEETAGKPPTFGRQPHAEGAHWIRFGWVDVAATGTLDDRRYQITQLHLEPESMAQGAPKILGSIPTFTAIKQDASAQDADILCYLHGFANSFESAIQRAAEIKEKLGERRKLVMFVFCWPSNGEMIPEISYHSDRNDAEASGHAMARCLLKLGEFVQSLEKEQRCDKAIHLLAHSMGNYALRWCVQALVRQSPGQRLPHMLDDVFLMAADEDNDCLERDDKLAPLLDLAKRVHVYHSEDDRALKISDWTKFNPDRLGSTGPRRRGGDRKIVPVNCKYVDIGPDNEDALTQHQYYRVGEEVVEDLRHVLDGMLPSEIPGRRFAPEDGGFLLLPFHKR